MTTDKKTLALIAKIDAKRKEIKDIEDYKLKTNQSIPYMGVNINLNVESKISSLVSIVTYLLSLQEFHYKACKLLEVEDELKYAGYSVTDWIDDIKLRIKKLQINNKRKQLDQLEQKLKNLMSHELKTEIELANIEKELE